MTARIRAGRSAGHEGPVARVAAGTRLWPWFVVLCLLAGAGCSVRTYPPVKYVPLLGAEKRTPTTQVLAEALLDRDLNVRAQAVELLGVLSQSRKGGVKKEVARVLGLALRDRDPGIRLQAVEKLGKMEGKYANKYLLAALRDPNTFIRDKVVRVLDERERQLLQPPPQAQPQESAPLSAGAP
jgi:hypothetical protein